MTAWDYGVCRLMKRKHISDQKGVRGGSIPELNGNNDVFRCPVNYPLTLCIASDVVAAYWSSVDVFVCWCRFAVRCTTTASGCWLLLCVC